MPRSYKKARVCLECNTLYKGLARDACPGCGSMSTQRVTSAGKEGGVVTPPTTTPTPTVTPPTIPTPPKPPGAPKVATPVKGGGAITPEALKAAKLKLKKVPATPVPGPPAGQSATPWGVRVICSRVKVPYIPQVWLGRRWKNVLYYLPVRETNLGNVLNLIAKGAVNPAHGHFNTRYWNNSRELPARPNPFVTRGVRYFEYGWATSVPSGDWYRWFFPSGAAAPRHVSDRLGGFLRDDGGKLDVTRLIVAETGELFFTPDHYESFYRYSFALKSWSYYRSPDIRYGEADWDASAYYN